MNNPSRFHKERALREAGQAPGPYPTVADFSELAQRDQLEADRKYLEACSAWEDAIDEAYTEWVKVLPPFEIRPGLREFAEHCQRYGITAGLAGLNARVEHRYTALYQLDDAKLRNIELIDKAGEVRPAFLAEVPFTDSFCQFVLRDGVFLTSDSSEDDRLNGHPYKGVMVAYHGVPVLAKSGELFGSLCHFDTEARSLSDEEFTVLSDAAKLISPYLMIKRGA